VTGKLRKHLTFSNTIALLALFVALGGTSYAVARNSVGAAQIKRSAVGASEIRTNAVSSREIKRGAVTLSKISPGAQSALKPPAAPPQIVRAWAAVAADGTLLRASAQGTRASASGSGPGTYSVGFPDVGVPRGSCVTLATVTDTSPTTQSATPGFATVEVAGGVAVRTYDPQGNPASRSFNIAVLC
jgi:hypothetical protein